MDCETLPMYHLELSPLPSNSQNLSVNPPSFAALDSTWPQLPNPIHRQLNERIVKALREQDSQLTVIASTRRMNAPIVLMHDNGIRIRLYPTKAVLSLPFGYVESYVKQVFATLCDYGQTITTIAGYVAHDPQLGRSVDLS